MVTIVYNTMYLQIAKEVDLRFSHYTKKKVVIICEVMDVLTNLIVVIILQYVHVSNHCVGCLKLPIEIYNNFIHIF